MKLFEVIVLEREVEVVQKAVAMIVSQVTKSPYSVLGFATGRTMIPIYKEISAMNKNGVVDFSSVVTFNLDEYVGMNGEDKMSFRRYMEKNLFSKVGVRKSNVHFLDGRKGDFEEECIKYEGEIALAGGIDFQLLGLGRDGHIGFDEPGSSLKSRTRRVELAISTRRANARDFGGRVGFVPRFALTMGLGTIMESRKILLIATGKNKANSVRCLLKNRISKSCPASVLRRHNNVTILLDRDAAGKI